MLRRPQRSLCLGSQEGSPEDEGGVGKSRKLAGGVCQRPPVRLSESGVAKRVNADVDERAWPSEDEFQGLLDVLAGKAHPKPVGCAELRKRKAELLRKER